MTTITGNLIKRFPVLFFVLSYFVNFVIVVFFLQKTEKHEKESIISIIIASFVILARG